MSNKIYYPSADRNKEPILQTLKQYISSKKGYFLEISSGTGQHVCYMAPYFTNIVFQPTEIDKACIKSINQYIAEFSGGNIKNAQLLDVRAAPNKWLGGSLAPGSIDYLLNVNMMHIAEWDCTEGLFKGAGVFLKVGGILFTYGPYAFNGSITPDSNVRFNNALQGKNMSWGLRDVSEELEPVAEANGLFLEEKHGLPANNHLLIWRKQ